MVNLELSPAERKLVAIRRKIHPHIYKLKYLGAAMVIFGAAGPMMILMKMFENTLSINMFVFMCIVMGPIVFIIGYVYDNGYVRAP
ncbi:MAG: hypothetical protein EPO32_05935 [Anaerolineae bacterium]|nr:MAG: hypothetical protein EPO32_05935 [Anaerolineae bacterium]